MRKISRVSLISIITILSFYSLAHAQCGALPLAYCGRTDTLTASGAAPTLGAAGTVTIDPDFGGKVLRATQGSSCGLGAGARFGPNGGQGWARSWNSDDTKFMVVEQTTNDFYYIVFDPVNFTVGSCVSITSKIGHEPNFAWQTTNRIYGRNGASTLAYWDTSAGSATTVFDLATIPGFTSIAPTFTEGDVNDQWFCTSNNTQDVGTQIGCYNQATTNTQVLNLAAATEKQNSSAPVALDNLTAGQLANCVIHEIQQDSSATWLYLTLNACTAFPTGSSVGNIFWQLGTNHVTYMPNAIFNSSHTGFGVNGAWINNPGSSPPCVTYDPRGWFLWFVTNFGTSGSPNYVQINPCIAIDMTFEAHLSWINNKSDANANKYPIIMEGQHNAANTGNYLEWELTAIQTAPGLVDWNNSAFQAASTGLIWRLAHSYNDNVAAQCPESYYVSPNVSRSGKFISFISDWMGQTGTGACTNSRRVDTFVLNAASAALGFSLTSGNKVTSGVSIR